MKIAYIHTERPTQYHDEFFAAMKSRWDTTRFEDYDLISNPDAFDNLFVEFAGGNAIKASQREHKNLIIKTHGVEVYECNLNLINWINVNWLLTLHHHQLSYFNKRWPNCHPMNQGVTHNQCLPDIFSLRRKPRNNNVAMVQNITSRKGEDQIPEFLLMYPKFHIHYLGKVCKYGNPVWEYVWWRLEKDGTKDRFHYQKILNFDFMSNWYEDMTYLWLPSIQEGHSRVVLEALCKGIKPIIRNHAGAKELWKHEFIYTKLEEIKPMLEGKYEPNNYRDYVINKYGVNRILDELEKYLKL